MQDEELKHYGVPGMKWGNRKNRIASGGISGLIRRRQMANANNSLSKINARKKQVSSELKELNSYAKNPSGLAKSKISTAIRNHQIKSLKKTQAELNSKEKDNKEALKELKDIENYQAKKIKQKEKGKAAIEKALEAYKKVKKKYK